MGIVEGVAIRPKAWSKDGKAIYYESGNNLFSLDVATGVTTQLTKLEKQSSYRNFSVDPAGYRICYVGVQNGQTDIWVASLRGENAVKLTNDLEEDRTPIWHPDGNRIVYTSNRGGAFQVCVANLDRAEPHQVTFGAEDQVVTDISKDGTRLLEVNSRDNAEIFGVDTHSGQELELTSGSGLMLWPEGSPDGEMITFQSTNAVGKIASNSTVFVKQTSSAGPLIQIAKDGFGPSWSPDGSRLAFLRFVGGQFDLFLASSSGEFEQRLTTSGVRINGLYLLPAAKFGRNICWSPNGEALVYSSRISGVTDLWIVATDGSSPKPLSVNADPKVSVYEPIFGPNNQIAYAAETYGDSPKSWSLWLKDGDKRKLIFQTNLKGAGRLVTRGNECSLQLWMVRAS